MMRSLRVALHDPFNLAALPEQSSTAVNTGFRSSRVYLRTPRTMSPFLSDENMRAVTSRRAPLGAPLYNTFSTIVRDIGG